MNSIVDIHHPSAVSVNEKDRLSFTIFLALCFHLIVILGIGFAPESAHNGDKILNVKLTQTPSEKAPEKADFIGQANQLSSGKDNKVVTEKTPVIAPFPSRKITPASRQKSQTARSEQSQTQLLSSYFSNRSLFMNQQRPNQTQQGQKFNGNNLSITSQAIASLQADLGQQRYAQSSNDRRRTVSAAIHQASDALYLDSWQRKIEKIGNINYPSKASIQNIHGTLRVKVSVRADGSLEKVLIIKSSGFKILDDAAIRIVHLAAPFSPLPPEITKTTDVLDIIRTWSFLPSNQLSTN